MATYRALTGLNYPTNEPAYRRFMAAQRRGTEMTSEEMQTALDELDMKIASRGDVVDDMIPASARLELEAGHIELVPAGSRHKDLPEPEPMSEPVFDPMPPMEPSSEPLPEPSERRMRRAGVFPEIDPDFVTGMAPLPDPPEGLVIDDGFEPGMQPNPDPEPGMVIEATFEPGDAPLPDPPEGLVIDDGHEPGEQPIPEPVPEAEAESRPGGGD